MNFSLLIHSVVGLLVPGTDELSVISSRSFMFMPFPSCFMTMCFYNVSRGVARYLKTLFDEESGLGRKSVAIDHLLNGKTRKEASRMFFETLVWCPLVFMVLMLYYAFMLDGS